LSGTAASASGMSLSSGGGWLTAVNPGTR
jgi:hypothetical protein